MDFFAKVKFGVDYIIQSNPKTLVGCTRRCKIQGRTQRPVEKNGLLLFREYICRLHQNITEGGQLPISGWKTGEICSNQQNSISFFVPFCKFFVCKNRNKTNKSASCPSVRLSLLHPSLQSPNRSDQTRSDGSPESRNLAALILSTSTPPRPFINIAGFIAPG